MRKIIFPITIFLSAFLLFQVQPLISRYILPWFGGAPAVWSTSMLFFQILLLAGYSYAHNLSKVTAKKLALHIILLVIAILLLSFSALKWDAPLLPGSTWKPPDPQIPIGRILLILSVGVGLPYFLLANTSSLLQAWHKLLYPNKTPYGYYALSNFGSLLALVSFPLLFEPYLALREMAWLWFTGFLVYATLVIFLSACLFRWAGNSEKTAVEPQLFAETLTQAAPPSLYQRWMWVTLPACTSILFLSVTSQLTQEVAVIPFLWILPLSIYLLSFVITFSGEGWRWQGLTLVFLAIFILLANYSLERGINIGVFPQIVIYTLFLLLATVVCHGELYRIKPEARHLTIYYLMLSAGGALGGVFASLIAPYLFSGYWELSIGMLLCCLLIGVALNENKGSLFHTRWVWLAAPGFVAVVGVTVFVFYLQINNALGGTLFLERNFYGVLRVRTISVGEPPMDAISLNHGVTGHGFQFIQPENKKTPTSYYGAQSGVGRAILRYAESVDPAPAGLRIGVIGLGTGTLAVYGSKLDYYRFYEINPTVIELALGKNGYFTYLRDAQAAYDIVPGDARISMEQELALGQMQDLDILAVDAFSSDAIPVHLLTQEAFAVYLRHLKPEGVLAIHISNRYLNLAPLVNAQGDLFGLYHALVASPRSNPGSYPAVWVLLSRNRFFFELLELEPDGPVPAGEATRLWTDDYSNLLPFLQMDTFFKAW